MNRPRSKTNGLLLGGIGRWLLVGLGLVAALAASTTTLAAKTETSKPVCGPYGDVPQEHSPIASRDGTTLAWLRHSWKSRRDRVWVSARDGSRARPVSVPDGSGWAYDVAIAPNGSQVLIAGGVGAILASTRRADSRILSESEAAEVRRAWRTPEWSPDGQFRISIDQDGLLIVPAEAGPSRRIATPGLTISNPAWSPDGRWIAFESKLDERGIHIVRSDGSGLRRLGWGDSDSFGPTWSPDGSRIAFWTDDRDVKGRRGQSIAVVRRQRPGAVWIPVEAHAGPDLRSARDASWIDSRTLVFSSYGLPEGPRTVADIHTIRIDGRGERHITYQCHLGTPGDDSLDGSILGDTIRTFAGNDVITGGRGSDDIDAGPGNDKIRTVDGERDLVRCGPGRDRVEAYRFDRVLSDCEIVIRQTVSRRRTGQ